ncbi:flippase [Reichenbachiella agarivorans]|uniref:Flippase n=1 Tax=Reichenbachiella agarivorans TaxID=2979464 RepID=A0ABY6CPJ0_9BACT|nr:flippase [Reichenbachiella agarivorans]UXP32433.1 flippase [Reichenbachiella agarivorans]
MSNLKYWINRASFSLINRFTIFFFGFATYFVLVRYLDKSDFGIYTLYMIIVTFTEMARNAFVQNGFVKHYVDERFNPKEVVTASLVLNVGLTVVSAFGLYIFAGAIGDSYKSNDLADMIRIYSYASILFVPYSQLTYYLSAHANFKQMSVLSICRYTSYFGMVLTGVLLDPTIDLIVLTQLHAVSIFIGSALALYVIIKIGIDKPAFSMPLIKTLFNFGKYTFGTGLNSFLTRSVDQLMLGYFISSEAVATYNIAGRFLNFIEIPIASISHMMYPKFANSINMEDVQGERARLYEKSTGMLLAAITPFILVIFIFPSFCITVIAGEKYLDAVPVLQIFIILNLLKPLGVQAGSVLEVAGKPKVIFYALLSSTVLNIICNYYLIRMEGPFGGYIGAALASALSIVFFTTIAMSYVYRECYFKFTGIFAHMMDAYRIGFELLKTKLSK